MVPESTSPVPAVARRASPVVTSRTSPPGSATTVVGALEQHHRVGRRGQPAGGVDAVGARTVPAQALELAVVGREHRGRVARPAPSRCPSARSPSPSTTTGTMDSATTRRTSAAPCSPSPGPTTRQRNRSDPSSTSSSQPCWSHVDADDLDRRAGRRGRHARERQPHVAGAGPGRRRGRQHRRARHARRAAHHPHRGPPLVRLRRSGRQPCRHVGMPRRGGPGIAGHVEADVGHG